VEVLEFLLLCVEILYKIKTMKFVMARYAAFLANVQRLQDARLFAAPL